MALAGRDQARRRSRRPPARDDRRWPPAAGTRNAHGGRRAPGVVTAIAALQNLQQVKAAVAAVDAAALGDADARAERLFAELAEKRSGPPQRSASAMTGTRDIQLSAA